MRGMSTIECIPCDHTEYDEAKKVRRKNGKDKKSKIKRSRDFGDTFNSNYKPVGSA